LPARLGRTSRALPTTAMWMLALLGATFAMLPGIEELLAFGSATFLGVFGLINHLHARTTERAVERMLGHLGSVACAAAIVVLFAQMAVEAPATLALLAGCLLVVAGLRLAFVRFGRRAGRARREH
ncbi:MAG TPA: hypothetical protein VII47_04730, partial [Actinomycetota bacterium]